MTPERASFLRKLFLVIVIVFDILMLIFWWLGGHLTFFWVFIAINICVLIGEVINAKFVYKKTLSTQATKTIEQGGKKAVYTYLAGILLVLTMLALCLHFFIH